jgi:hypothetical protein
LPKELEGRWVERGARGGPSHRVEVGDAAGIWAHVVLKRCWGGQGRRKLAVESGEVGPGG